MKLLKNYNFKWWEVGMLKVTLLAVGVVIGAWWSDFFINYLEMLILLAAAGMVYFLIFWIIRK